MKSERIKVQDQALKELLMVKNPKEGQEFNGFVFHKGRWEFKNEQPNVKNNRKNDSVQSEVIYIFALVQTIQIIMMIGIIGLIIFK
jgi:hypothetical protein